MNLGRRDFLYGSAAAITTLPLSGMAKSSERLTIGIASDLHIASDKLWQKDNPLCKWQCSGAIRRALTYFRSKEVDAVVLCGDLADNGLTDELMCLSRAWYDIFPNDCLPSGKKVEKIFILGNHDWESWGGGKVRNQIIPDPQERARHILKDHIKEVWRQAFHEDFIPVVDKTVKGYRFCGANWPYHRECKSFLESFAKKCDPSKPFFYIQHPHLKGTVYGSWSWGCDDGVATSILSRYPNAIALSGHSHYTLTDERSIWQDSFTSVAAGSLRYTAPVKGFENTGGDGSEFKQMPVVSHGWCAQAMCMTLENGIASCERVDFGVSGAMYEILGSDWVFPAIAKGSDVYSFVKRAEKAKAPAFAADAKVSVVVIKDGKTRGGRPVNQVGVSFPAALTSSAGRGRALSYEVEVLQSDADFSSLSVAKRRVLGYGFNKSEQHAWEPGETDVSCVFSVDALPFGSKLEFRAYAIESFGKRSSPISSGVIQLGKVVNGR
jgi:predicted phosphodiesterase